MQQETIVMKSLLQVFFMFSISQAEQKTPSTPKLNAKFVKDTDNLSILKSIPISMKSSESIEDKTGEAINRGRFLIPFKESTADLIIFEPPKAFILISETPKPAAATITFPIS